jgi:hypothetical protein
MPTDPSVVLAAPPPPPPTSGGARSAAMPSMPSNAGPSNFEVWEQFGKMAKSAMAPKVETQTVQVTTRGAEVVKRALEAVREENGGNHGDGNPGDGGELGTSDWLRQVLTAGGLKPPNGGSYLDEDGAETAAADAASCLVPESVGGNDDWEKFPERRPKPRVPAAIANGGPFASTRISLPVYAFREALIEGIDRNRVTIVEGDTGCGKTTQVPQYVLEEATRRHEPVYVMCTQPRRISAMGVAARVAEERGEELGATVGYSIRLETKAGAKTQVRSSSHWFPYDPVRVVNADP